MCCVVHRSEVVGEVRARSWDLGPCILIVNSVIQCITVQCSAMTMITFKFKLIDGP